MKIILLSDAFPPDGIGGDTAVVLSLAAQYLADGHDVFVVTVTERREHEGRGEWLGVPVERIYVKSPAGLQSWVSLWNPRPVRVFKQVLAEFKPDVVHAHSISTYLSFYTLVAAKLYGARVFYTIHDAMLYHYGKARDESRVSEFMLMKEFRFAYNPLRRSFMRWVLWHVDGIIAVSESIGRANSNNGIPVSAVIHNGIDSTQWGISEEKIYAFKKKHSLGEQVILFGGRLSGLKGAFATVEALAQVAHKIPGVQLLVIGAKNSTANTMIARASKLGVEQRIVFSGHVSGEELRAAYYAAALVVVPSLYVDPFPTINLEAHACGKPVVATVFGGSQEVVLDGKTGFLVDPSDVASYSEKIATLLRDPELAARFGAAGKARVKAEFTIEKQAKAYEQLFLSFSSA